MNQRPLKYPVRRTAQPANIWRLMLGIAVLIWGVGGIGQHQLSNAYGQESAPPPIIKDPLASGTFQPDPVSAPSDQLSDLTAGQAADVAEAANPGLFEPAPTKLLDLIPGQSVVRFEDGDHTALVTDSDKHHALVTSTLPLVSDADGSRNVVDTQLTDGDHFFGEASGLTDVRFSKQLDGVDDLTTGLVGLGLEHAASVSGRQLAQQVLYPNVLTDTDLLASALPTGFESFVQLRSVDSPESFTLEATVPQGMELRRVDGKDANSAGDEDPGFEVVDGARVVSIIQPIHALDNNDANVPVTATLVDGTRIKVTVPHGAATAYPVLVDPLVENQLSNPNDSNSNFSRVQGWRYGYQNVSPGYYPSNVNPSAGYSCPIRPNGANGYTYQTNELCIGNYAGVNYGAQSAGVWYWTPTGATSYVYRTDWRASVIPVANPGNVTRYAGGLASPSLGWVGRERTTEDGQAAGGFSNSPYQRSGPVNGSYTFYQTSCLDDYCSEPQSNTSLRGTYAAFYLVSSGSTSQVAATLMGAEMWVSDMEYPNVASTSSNIDTSGATWYKDGVSVQTTVTGADNGVGVASDTISVPQTSGPPFTQAQGGSCLGVYCASATLAKTFSYSTSGMPEGVNTVTTGTFDQLSRPGTTTFAIKVDRTSPAVPALSGQLAQRNGAGVNGTYSLTADASDQWSGVRGLELLVDNMSVSATMAGIQAPTQADPGLGGGMHSNLDFDTSTLAEGRRSITVRATDGVSLTRDSTVLSLIVDRTKPNAPASIQTDATSEGTAVATWNASSDVDPAPSNGQEPSGIASYNVRYQVGSNPYSSWKNYPAAAKQSDPTPPAAVGTPVTFQVTAVDGAGNESPPTTVADTIDGTVPDVDASGTTAANDGGYVNGTTKRITVSAVDDSSGVSQLRLEDPSGTLIQGKSNACAASACPLSDSADLSVDFGKYPEGPITFTAAAIDAVQDRSLDDDLDFVIDKTPPATPSSLKQTAASADGSSFTLTWTEPGDPAIDATTPGSGDSAQYRYQRAGDSAFSPWVSTDQNEAPIPAATGVPTTVQVQSVDAAGNASSVTTQTIIPVADALITDLSSDVVTTTNESTTQSLPTVGADRPAADGGSGQPAPVYGDTPGPDSQSPSDSDADDNEGRANEGLGSMGSACRVNFDSSRVADVPSDVRHFTPERSRLGARLYLYCLPSADVSRIKAVTYYGQFAYRVGSGRTYREIGLRHVVRFGRLKASRQYFFNGVRNFCNPGSSGAQSYLAVGVLKFEFDDHDPVTRLSNTDFNKEQTLTCPGPDLRRFREAAGYASLSAFSPDLNDSQPRQPSIQLRSQLGAQPYVPASAGLRPWEAHHIVPVRDRSNRVSRALAFRCRLQPNVSDDGLYLRGSGLRKTRGGRTTRAYSDLQTLDGSNGTLHLRTYHPDTFRNTYYYADQLAARFYDARSQAVDECSSGARNTMMTELAAAKSDLARGVFGVEQPGH